MPNSLIPSSWILMEDWQHSGGASLPACDELLYTALHGSWCRRCNGSLTTTGNFSSPLSPQIIAVAGTHTCDRFLIGVAEFSRRCELACF